jgi:hypothetical protein
VPVSLLLAQSRHAQCADECPLLGAKRMLTNRCLPISIMSTRPSSLASRPPKKKARGLSNNIMLFMSTLPFYALRGAKFFCSLQFARAVFLRLMVAGGGNSLDTLMNAGMVDANGTPLRYLGVPIVISQKMPLLASPSGKIGCLYGNAKLGIAFGDRRQMTIRKSLERYFDTDQIGILGTERISIVAHGTYAPVGVVISTTNASTAAANATLHFASVPAGVQVGMGITDLTTTGVIPSGALVASTTSTTVVMSANAAGAGVGSGDTIQFANNGPIVAFKVG